MGYGSSFRNNPLRNEPSAGQSRQVYPTGEIPHKWAHAALDCARNAQGNLYFKGDTIYSYRDTWPLAKIHRKRGAPSINLSHGAEHGTLVLANSERASVTTAKHQWDVNRAVSHLERIDCPRVTPSGAYDHERNLQYFASFAREAMAKAQRAMTEATAGAYVRDARKATADAAAYMAFFGIRRKAPAFDQAAANAAMSRARRIENPDPASLDKRERANAARRESKRLKEIIANERRHLIEIPCARSAWRLGGEFGVRAFGAMPGPVMLRLCDTSLDECIETSMGARIPLASAPMVWQLVERSRAEGGRKFQGHIKIGDYSVNEITADGDLRVGCHLIPHSELRSMARTLKLI